MNARALSKRLVLLTIAIIAVYALKYIDESIVLFLSAVILRLSTALLIALLSLPVVWLLLQLTERRQPGRDWMRMLTAGFAIAGLMMVPRGLATDVPGWIVALLQGSNTAMGSL